MEELIKGIVEKLTKEQKQIFIDYLLSLTEENQTPLPFAHQKDD